MSIWWNTEVPWARIAKPFGASLEAFPVVFGWRARIKAPAVQT
jgi:hypothetical protein